MQPFDRIIILWRILISESVDRRHATTDPCIHWKSNEFSYITFSMRWIWRRKLFSPESINISMCYSIWCVIAANLIAEIIFSSSSPVLDVHVTKFCWLFDSFWRNRNWIAAKRGDNTQIACAVQSTEIMSNHFVAILPVLKTGNDHKGGNFCCGFNNMISVIVYQHTISISKWSISFQSSRNVWWIDS